MSVDESRYAGLGGKIQGTADVISFIHFVIPQKTGKLACCLYLNQIKITIFTF
jgi:hypothetical protein